MSKQEATQAKRIRPWIPKALKIICTGMIMAEVSTMMPYISVIFANGFMFAIYAICTIIE